MLRAVVLHNRYPGESVHVRDRFVSQRHNYFRFSRTGGRMPDGNGRIGPAGRNQLVRYKTALRECPEQFIQLIGLLCVFAT